MRKIIEWKRRNADNSFEVHFLNAEDYPANYYSVTVDGITWRVINTPNIGHVFTQE